MASERETENSSRLTCNDFTGELADDDQINQDGAQGIDKSMFDLKSCREWLEQQKLDYEAELKTKRTAGQEEQEVAKPTEPNIQELYQSISNLQEQLFDVSSSRSTKKLVLERLQLSHEMKKILTDEEVVDSESSKGIFNQLCEEQSELSKEILKYHQALEVEQSTLKEIQRERMEVNQELMKQLQELKLAKEPRQTQKETQVNSSVQKQIMEIQDMTTVAGNICQALVVGSNINWAADDDLRKLVLDLGKPHQFLER